MWPCLSLSLSLLVFVCVCVHTLISIMWMKHHWTAYCGYTSFSRNAILPAGILTDVTSGSEYFAKKHLARDIWPRDILSKIHMANSHVHLEERHLDGRHMTSIRTNRLFEWQACARLAFWLLDISIAQHSYLKMSLCPNVIPPNVFRPKFTEPITTTHLQLRV